LPRQLARLSPSCPQRKKTARELFPASTIGYLEIPQPRHVLATVLDHPLTSLVQQSPDYQKALATPEYEKFLEGVGLVEDKLGMKWRPAAESLTDGGLYFGFDLPTQGVAMLAQATDEKLAEKARDSATNRKTHPNENFAREVMELFCLGVGRYTEKDIQQLARCFTGWEIQHGEFKFNQFQHDYGMKTVLGKSGAFDGDEGLKVILEQPATAEFLCAKLVRFFVSHPGQSLDV